MPLPVAVSSCSAAWGDYDGDGFLDLALAGDTSSGSVCKVYRNVPGGSGRTFSETASLTGGWEACVAWGDYDNDGDLDLALAGNGSSGRISRVYRNDGGAFTDIGAGLTGVDNAGLAWGDYDNDGDLDLALAGNGSSWRISRIYRNDGGAFTDIGAVLPGFLDASLAWGDCDNDGDLDLALAGDTGSGVYISRIYRNDGGVLNTAPSAPSGLSATLRGGELTMSWNAAADTETPANGLSYNIRVGTTAGACDIFSGMASSAGLRRLPATGNAQKKLTWTIKGVTAADVYWSVQAVDTSFAGSAWAAESHLQLADTAPPVINTVAVAPILVAGSDAVYVSVNASDNVGVASVTANGTALTGDGNGNWTGTLTADSALGLHPVAVEVRDAADNLAADTAHGYTTAPVYSLSNRDVFSELTMDWQTRFLFMTWGVVAVLDGGSFTVDDGSGKPVTVYAAAHGLDGGEYAIVRGVLSRPSQTEASLTTSRELIRVFSAE